MKPEAIGIGAAGQIDRQRGVLLSGPNLGEHMDNLPIGAQLTKRFSLPVTVGNDVEVGAAGEHGFGAGKGHDDFVCVFVGTGIGGAIVRDGEALPRRRADGRRDRAYRRRRRRPPVRLRRARTPGSLRLALGRRPLRSWASCAVGGQSVLRAAVDAEGPEMPGGTAIRSKALAKAVAEGDDLAVEAVDDGRAVPGRGHGLDHQLL